MQNMSIHQWSQNVNLCLTRTVAGELGKIATQLADERRIPLLREVSEQGNKRNKYPQVLIVDAWEKYKNINPHCPEITHTTNEVPLMMY